MTVEQAVYNIRHAQYGEEVRESIAEGIETIDQDVTDQNLEAESWAAGTRNGEPVPTTDPAYHNNAKYFAQQLNVEEIYQDIQDVQDQIVSGHLHKTLSDLSVASFSDGADNIPVKSLIINIDPVQSGSGDPSPTNVREISGWDSVSLGQTLAGYVMPTIEQGGINVRGEDTVSDIRCRSDYVPVSGVTHIAFAVQGNARIIAIHRYDSDKNWISRIPYSDGKTSGSIILESGTAYLKFLFAKADIAANIVPGDIENLVVAPYSSISLGQTVYGGTLRDNGDGTWTLQPTHVLIDAANISWTVRSSSNTMWVYLTTDFVTGAVDYAEKYVQWTGAINDTPLNNFRVSATSGVYVNTGDNTDASNKPTGKLVLKYKSDMLPDPITLTAESVKTLLGQNNIFADCGDIAELTYCVDPNTERSEQEDTDSELKRMILVSFPTDSIENAAVAFFTDGADRIPVKALTVNITPVQSGSGDPSPENVREISGWTGANISRAGTNLMNPLLFQDTTVSDGVYTDTNTVANAVLNGENDLSTGGQFLRAGTYTFSYKPSTGPIWNRVIARYSDGTTERVATPTESGDYVVGTFTLEQDAYVLIRHSGTGTSVFSEPQIESGSSRTTYSPYSGTTYQVSWQSEAGTVYGGTLTDNGDGTWTLTVTHKQIVLNGTENGWALSRSGAATNCFSIAIEDAYCPNRIYVSCISSHFYSPESLPAAEDRANTIFFEKFGANETTFPSYLNIGASSDIGSTVADFLAWLANNNVSVVYKLATPATYTLTAESVKTLLGDNNIFADCGDINMLTYRADVGLYITKKLAEVTS